MMNRLFDQLNVIFMKARMYSDSAHVYYEKTAMLDQILIICRKKLFFPLNRTRLIVYIKIRVFES